MNYPKLKIFVTCAILSLVLVFPDPAVVHAERGKNEYLKNHYKKPRFAEFNERNHQAWAFKKWVKSRIWHVMSKYSSSMNAQTRLKISNVIYNQSKKYGYDPLFLTAVIITESSFNHWARSHKGALGLMQIRPRTGKALARELKVPWRGKRTLLDPRKNIILGSYYLHKLNRRFGSLVQALEAYNHGPTKISRYLKRGRLPRKYSRKVYRHYREIKSSGRWIEETPAKVKPKSFIKEAKTSKFADNKTVRKIEISSGETLWKLSRKLGYGKKDAVRVAVALWMDNVDAFIKGNLHGIRAGETLNLSNLDNRLEVLNHKKARKIFSRQWKKWINS